MAGRRTKKPTPPPAIERRPSRGPLPALEIRASTRRRKTATAWWEGAVLIVAMPAHVRGPEREELIAWLVERSSTRRPSLAASDVELLARARSLVDAYDLGATPSSVRFVSNQSRRWGSCTPATGAIRLSDRLKLVPGWVLDAVLVHELAHLVHPDHGAAFRELANRFPRQPDATLFLEGYQLGTDRRAAEVPEQPSAEAPSTLPARPRPDPELPDGVPRLF